MNSLEFSSESNELKEFSFEDFNSDVATSNPIQLNKKYIVSKTKSGLIIINQERAHQRILYEEFLKSVTLNKVNPQKLLHPLEIDFSKENENLKILGGIMGSDILDVAGVKNVATLPSLDEARAKIVGILRSPAQKIASILLAPASKIAILALEKSKK